MIARGSGPGGRHRHRKCHWRPVQLEECGAEPVGRPRAAHRQPTRVRRRSREVHAYSVPPAHPCAAATGRARPDSGPGCRRSRCPRCAGPPLPDPDGDAAVARPRLGPALRRRAVTASSAGRGPGPPGGDGQPRRRQPARPAASGRAVRTGPRAGPGRRRARGQDQPGQEHRPMMTRAPAGGPPARPTALAGPVRPGAGGDAGRVPAAEADIVLDHRAGPGPDPAPGPACSPPASRPQAPPGGGVPARVRRDGDDRGGRLRAAGPGAGRPVGAQPRHGRALHRTPAGAAARLAVHRRWRPLRPGEAPAAGRPRRSDRPSRRAGPLAAGAVARVAVAALVLAARAAGAQVVAADLAELVAARRSAGALLDLARPSAVGALYCSRAGRLRPLEPGRHDRGRARPARRARPAARHGPARPPLAVPPGRPPRAAARPAAARPRAGPAARARSPAAVGRLGRRGAARQACRGPRAARRRPPPRRSGFPAPRPGG